jgi:hypothetical protein
MASILHTRPHGRMASIAAVAVATALALARSWALRFGGQAMVNRAAAPALRASTYPRRTSAGPSADRCRHRAARGRTISRASTPRIVHFGPPRPRARHFGPEVIPPGSTLRI